MRLKGVDGPVEVDKHTDSDQIQLVKSIVANNPMTG